jgi:hypothetical protein
MYILGLGPTCLPKRLKVLEDCYLPVSVYTLPLRVRSHGRAPARPMGFPPPLVPHINCEPRRPLPTERWDWVVCRNALWVNRLWSAVYLYHTWELDRSLPRPLLVRRQERSYTAHRSLRRGPLQCVTRIGPPKGTLTSSARKHSRKPCSNQSVNFGELSAPLISRARRPAPRPPSGDGSRRPEGPTLGLCHRPSPNPLVSISFPQLCLVTTSGELSAPLVQKWVT